MRGGLVLRFYVNTGLASRQLTRETLCRGGRRDSLSGDVAEYLRTHGDAHMDSGECYHAWTIQSYAGRGVEYVGRLYTVLNCFMEGEGIS